MVNVMELVISRKEKQMLARVLSLLNNKELSIERKTQAIKENYSSLIHTNYRCISVCYNQATVGAKWFQFELTATPAGECWVISLIAFGKLSNIIRSPKEDREDLILRLLVGGHKGLKHVVFYNNMGFEIKYSIHPLDAEDYDRLMQGKLDIYVRTYSI